MKRLLYLVALSGLLSGLPAQANDTNVKQYPVDKQSGLIMAPGWELVNYQCNACHSSLIIPQNGGDEAFWRETIQWMIDTQGLWDLSETWDPVLQYLSTNYPASSDIPMDIFRRLPLESDALPEKPATPGEKG
ncbi:hypothetical protein [Candidatus Sororendozoicomonas aggregata]|uniref:hypothetical protein n=1 Tax=Candidatus Sororendozoicomonas aggregata TaxID=3073239 RepID=UPI002ED60F32